MTRAARTTRTPPPSRTAAGSSASAQPTSSAAASQTSSGTAGASSASMPALTLGATWDPRPTYRPIDAERAGRKAFTASAVWRSPMLQLADVPVPRPLPGEVLVRVRCCGVCGSDAHCYETDADGYVRFSGMARLPVVLGHEFAGDVVEVGRDVTTLRVGDAVTAESVRWCGICTACRSGNPNQCGRVELMGLSAPGAMATYVAVHERYCWPLDALRETVSDDEQPYELGALVEPIGCAYNGLFVAGGGFRPGAYVSIYGAGPIGLGALLLARAAGAAKVFVFDVSGPRVALAMALGADHAANPLELKRQGSSPAEVVRDMTGGHGADVQVEAAGAAGETIPQVEQSFAANGKLIYLGRADDAATLHFDALVTRGNHVIGARGHAGHGSFRSVIRLLASGRVPARAMITSRYPLDRAADAVAHACGRTEGKVLVRCT